MTAYAVLLMLARHVGERPWPWYVWASVIIDTVAAYPKFHDHVVGWIALFS